MNRYASGLIALIGILAALALILQPGFAVTNNTTAATATATVSDTISVTLSFVPPGSGITFGSLNAGTNNNSATNNLNVSIDTITNVATNISMNGSANFVSGGDTFGIGNLRYSNASGATGLTDSAVMTTSFPDPSFTNWINISKPSTVNTYRDGYFWLTIPSGQVAGSYSANIYINVTKYV